MTRALATIQIIESVTPIPDADAIETVSMVGILWQVVVRKSLGYRPGERVVFFEIDSVLPNVPPLEEMLRGKPWSPRAARLKTVKFRGQISQGYVQRYESLIPYMTTDPAWDGGIPAIGDDASKSLGVIKYEPPAKGDNDANTGHWLHWSVPKTDEPRVQSHPKLVDSLIGQPYIITVKLDGMSGTFGEDENGQFWACSRNFRLVWNPDRSNHCKVAERYALADACRAYGGNLVFQGEVCGPGIQGNRLGLDRPDLFVFNIWDKAAQEYLSWPLMVLVCTRWGIPTVPLEETGTDFCCTAQELLERAVGRYPSSGQEREGIVIRGKGLTNGRRVSVKAISNKFLLRGGD